MFLLIIGQVSQLETNSVFEKLELTQLIYVYWKAIKKSRIKVTYSSIFYQKTSSQAENPLKTDAAALATLRVSSG